MSHDTTLQHAVTAELIWDPAVTSSEIGVTAKDGVVALTGQVDNYVEKLAAEAAARRVRGVKAIVQQIEVHVPFSLKRSDEDIAATAVSRLAWNVAVPPDRISLKVSKGVITLTGEVDRHFQSEAAERELRHLSGVVAVDNRVTVLPQVDVADVSATISEALDRSWLFDPATVTVTADGGTVHLGGTVRTMQERREAVGAAWACPGTTAVDNRISIV
ncbi:BON domain-containing protein [Methylobacterium sp. J-076]|uniref:BON domain-containing protein n=1 Tax=Methylobacterium sp. J-076 TaxID=2836655 RepID=UPI001FB8EC65|nr:BON domain-containing protein [Methylobacterium sp. J-076]MCJ2013581.1 BON domain-containing protein [Methylobacterium sp. J-076]